MAAVMSPPASSTNSSSSLSSHSPSPHPALSQLPPLATPASPQQSQPQQQSQQSSQQQRPSSKRTPRPTSNTRQSMSANSAQPSSKRQSQSYAQNRLSTLSTSSRTSRTYSNSNLRGESSRTQSTVFPLFHSSLPYSLVRDFGYPITDPLHYGPLPDSSGLATPASESNRRLSDPSVSYGDARSIAAFGGWKATDDYSQLPSRSFADGGESSGEWPRLGDHGPPYSEDEDLQSPVISSYGSHRRQQSNVTGMDRTRGRAGSRGMMTGSPILDHLPGQRRRKKKGRKRDLQDGTSNRESKGTLPSRSFHEGETYASTSEDDTEDDDDATPVIAHSPQHLAGALHNTHLSADDEDEEDEEHRHSMTYTFSIASPDEECHGKAVSLYNFERENDNELPLTEGQIILVSYRLSQGWLVAQDPRSGESGLVPESYVRLFRDLEGWEADEEVSNLNSLGSSNTNNNNNNNNNNNVEQAHTSSGAGGNDSDNEPEQIPNNGVRLPSDTTAPDNAQHDSSGVQDNHNSRRTVTTASPEPLADTAGGRESLESLRTPTSAAPHKPAITSTFSTSRDDLEPRRDLVKQEERRGSLDKRSRSPTRTGSRGKGKR